MGRYRIFFSCMMAASAVLLTASCTELVTGDDASGEERPAVISVSTEPMTIIGEQVPYGTKGFEPLPPEKENVIYSLAVLVFDVREGLLHPFTDGLGKGKLYRYMNLRDENGMGLLNTVLGIDKGFPVSDGESYTICLVANLSEERLDGIIEGMLNDPNSPGDVFINEFKEVKVPIGYITDGEDIGLVEDIYMFGYYQGKVNKGTDVSVTLGRIISRLEIALTVDPSVTLDPSRNFYYRWTNLETEAYLFPSGKSPETYEEMPRARIMKPDLSRNPVTFNTFYLYSAPNAADSESKALCLNMWYLEDDRPEIPSGELPEPNARIYLCNDRPGVADRNWQLNRNSVYRFNLRLTSR